MGLDHVESKSVLVHPHAASHPVLPLHLVCRDDLTVQQLLIKTVLFSGDTEYSFVSCETSFYLLVLTPVRLYIFYLVN